MFHDRSFATNEPVTGDVRLPRPNGVRILELVTSPHTDPQEGIRVCHAAVFDVTSRIREVQHRAELLAMEHDARVLAESTSAMKEKFLAVVSHELRTPLGPMLMWLGVLERDEMDIELRKRAILAIAECARAQAALIDDLVDTARGNTGSCASSTRRSISCMSSTTSSNGRRCRRLTSAFNCAASHLARPVPCRATRTVCGRSWGI